MRSPPNDSRGIFHRSDSFFRRVARTLPVVGGIVDFIPSLPPKARVPFGGPTDIVATAPGRNRPFATWSPQRLAEQAQTCSPGGWTCDQINLELAFRGGMVGIATQRLPGIQNLLKQIVPGGQTGTQMVTTNFGNGSAPNITQVRTRRCTGKGMVLDEFGLCVKRTSIRNSDRMWPAARKPLLTGGDLKAISQAARAAKRLQTQTKRLQKMGMLPKPKPSSRGRKSLPGPHTHHGGVLKVVEEITN